MRKFLRFLDKLKKNAKDKHASFWKKVTDFINISIFMGLPVGMGLVVYCGLANAGKQALGILSFLIVTMIAFYLETYIVPLFHEVHEQYKEDEPEEASESMEKRYIKRKMPYFGEKFGTELFDKVTEKEKYLPLIYADGHTSDIISINDADKWVCIDGQYFPLDLIYGYNLGNNELYTVDGRSIKLSDNIVKKQGRYELKTFLEKRGSFRENKINKAGTYYNRTFAGHDTDLPKADWAKGRYFWEKKVANELHGQNSVPTFIPVDELRRVNPEIFTRVLSKHELSKLKQAVSGEEDELLQAIDFNRYANEFTLCNGIELIRLLNNSNYEPGMDFLFDCLRDIDEACFQVAVSALTHFPTDKVKEKLEERARLAYESGDAIHLAGLLYLAKEMNISIDYIENIKKGDFAGKVREFLVEEQEKEPVAFELGGSAYLKQ